MISMKTSEPLSSAAIFCLVMKKKMSAVRVTKIRDFDVTPPRKSAFQIETPPDVGRAAPAFTYYLLGATRWREERRLHHLREEAIRCGCNAARNPHHTHMGLE